MLNITTVELKINKKNTSVNNFFFRKVLSIILAIIYIINVISKVIHNKDNDYGNN